VYFQKGKKDPPKADHVADAKQAILRFRCAADVKAYMEEVIADTVSGKLPASACQPINSMLRTMLGIIPNEDLSAVPDAIKALSSEQLYEQMARALPTQVLQKELATR
jgi:hypothetical protein